MQETPVISVPHVATVLYELLLRISKAACWLDRRVSFIEFAAQLLPGWPLKSPLPSRLESTRALHLLEGQELISASLSTLEHETGILEASIKLGQMSSTLPLSHI
jgi:hypothetical protein